MSMMLPVLAAVILAGLLLVIASALPSYASPSTSSTVNTTLTPNQLAAGGPLPGNLTQECIIAEQSETQSMVAPSAQGSLIVHAKGTPSVNLIGI